MKFLITAAGFFLATLFSIPALAQTRALVTEEMMVKTADPGIEIYVRNKRPADMTSFRPEQTVLYVHGATYPSRDGVRPQARWRVLDGIHRRARLRRLAARPARLRQIHAAAEMADKPEANAPIVTGETAVKDIGTAVDFILQRRNIPRLNLLGWSWGTTLMATYTTQNAAKVERLVLYAPAWIRQTPSLVQAGPGKLGAYRMVNRDQAKERWYTGVPEDKKASLIPAGWFDAWADATFATDPVGAAMNPPVLRAPNGVVQDSAEFFGAGKPYYDPAKITVPTLLVHAEWDRDTPPYMAQTLFPLLVNSPGKRYVALAEGTHTIIMETQPAEAVRGGAGVSG